jgi:uncharacterized membrane-anchored protein
MPRWYKYLFYRAYLWRRSAAPQTPISIPDFDAALIVAAATTLYLLGILAILAAFSNSFHHLFLDDIGRTKVITFCFAVAMPLLHGYMLAWHGNLARITKEFKASKPTRFKTFGVSFYILFSFVFFMMAGLLLWPSINAQLPHF